MRYRRPFKITISYSKLCRRVIRKNPNIRREDISEAIYRESVLFTEERMQAFLPRVSALA